MADDAPILNAFKVRVQVEVDQEDLERQIQEVVTRATGRFGDGLTEQARAIGVGGQGEQRHDAEEAKNDRLAQAVAEAVERTLGGLFERLEAGRLERIEDQDTEEGVDIRKLESILIDNEQQRTLDDIAERLARVVELLEERLPQ